MHEAGRSTCGSSGSIGNFVRHAFYSKALAKVPEGRPVKPLKGHVLRREWVLVALETEHHSGCICFRAAQIVSLVPSN